MQNENTQPDYGFILDPGQQPKKTVFSSGNNKKQRILIAITGGAILLVLIIVGFSLIFGGSSSEQALEMAQKHTELIRVAQIGTEKAKDTQAKNLAITTKLTLQSSQPQLLKIANQKADSKSLLAGKNEATDKALTEAEQNNRFDEVFIEKVNAEIDAYLVIIKSVYDKTSSAGDKQILNDIFNKVSALNPDKQKQ